MLICGPFCAFIIFFPNLNAAEWVDMPQFSDENKIYRIPSTQQDQFYKFRRGDASDNFLDDQRNNSGTFRPPVKTTHTMDDKTEIKRISSAPESTTTVYLFPNRATDSLAEISETLTPTSIDVEDKLSDRHDTVSPVKNTTFKTSIIPSSATHRQETPQNQHYNHTLKQDNDILQYLPVDILKSVHRTLRSQPASFEGKLGFLKMFEKTLMSEIESRLVATMSTPSRRARGADYYGHGYDDHDDHSVGFPSIEGALMAISFLTFAVYLVRLVMLLFRNINNPMTTTTAATLFLGKRKRSADLDDDAARILNNINGFISNF